MPIDLKLIRQGHLLILPDVYLNGQGPFRMLIDTGNATSLLRPEVARRLSAAPAYRVEWATVAGSRQVPAIVLDEVRTGSVSENAVEALVGDGLPSGVDGILGQTWLIRHDYLLDYRGSRLQLDGPAPPAGSSQRLRLVEGRPAIPVLLDRHPAELVLDSGAQVLVLFGGYPIVQQVTLSTNSGSMPAGITTATLGIPGEKSRTVSAARIAGISAAGLLPLCAYSTVWVSNREGVVVLVR